MQWRMVCCGRKLHPHRRRLLPYLDAARVVGSQLGLKAATVLAQRGSPTNWPVVLNTGKISRQAMSIGTASFEVLLSIRPTVRSIVRSSAFLPACFWRQKHRDGNIPSDLHQLLGATDLFRADHQHAKYLRHLCVPRHRKAHTVPLSDGQHLDSARRLIIFRIIAIGGLRTRRVTC